MAKVCVHNVGSSNKYPLVVHLSDGQIGGETIQTDCGRQLTNFYELYPDWLADTDVYKPCSRCGSRQEFEAVIEVQQEEHRQQIALFNRAGEVAQELTELKQAHWRELNEEIVNALKALGWQVRWNPLKKRYVCDREVAGFWYEFDLPEPKCDHHITGDGDVLEHITETNIRGVRRGQDL